MYNLHIKDYNIITKYFLENINNYKKEYNINILRPQTHIYLHQ